MLFRSVSQSRYNNHNNNNNNNNNNNTNNNTTTTETNTIVLNTIDRTNKTGDQTASPIYIQENATVSSQLVTFNGRVGINTITPASCSALDITSTTQGFLPPRMTGAQAEAISTKVEGLLVYSSDGTGTVILSKGWWGWSGSTWEKLN